MATTTMMEKDHVGDLSFRSEQSASSSSRTLVSFGDVHIREFERIAGDHPDATGPPLSIGWSFNEAKSVSLESYEQRRGIRSGEAIQPLSATLRQNILQYSFGISADEIRDQTQEALKAKQQRFKSNNQSKLRAHVEVFVRSLSRKARSKHSS